MSYNSIKVSNNIPCFFPVLYKLYINILEEIIYISHWENKNTSQHCGNILTLEAQRVKTVSD